MSIDVHERCLKCQFWDFDHNKCGNTFQAVVNITPLGGTVIINTTPGLVPAQLKPKLEDALGRIFENVTMVIENWPGWKDFYALQEADPERKDCPGREEKRIPHLKIVKF